MICAGRGGWKPARDIFFARDYSRRQSVTNVPPRAKTSGAKSFPAPAGDPVPPETAARGKSGNSCFHPLSGCGLGPPPYRPFKNLGPGPNGCMASFCIHLIHWLKKLRDWILEPAGRGGSEDPREKNKNHDGNISKIFSKIFSKMFSKYFQKTLWGPAGDPVPPETAARGKSGNPAGFRKWISRLLVALPVGFRQPLDRSEPVMGRSSDHMCHVF